MLFTFFFSFVSINSATQRQLRHFAPQIHKCNSVKSALPSRPDWEKKKKFHTLTHEICTNWLSTHSIIKINCELACNGISEGVQTELQHEENEKILFYRKASSAPSIPSGENNSKRKKKFCREKNWIRQPDKVLPNWVIHFVVSQIIVGVGVVIVIADVLATWKTISLESITDFSLVQIRTAKREKKNNLQANLIKLIKNGSNSKAERKSVPKCEWNKVFNFIFLCFILLLLLSSPPMDCNNIFLQIETKCEHTTKAEKKCFSCDKQTEILLVSMKSFEYEFLFRFFCDLFMFHFVHEKVPTEKCTCQALCSSFSTFSKINFNFIICFQRKRAYCSVFSGIRSFFRNVFASKKKITFWKQKANGMWIDCFFVG